MPRRQNPLSRRPTQRKRPSIRRQRSGGIGQTGQRTNNPNARPTNSPRRQQRAAGYAARVADQQKRDATTARAAAAKARTATKKSEAATLRAMGLKPGDVTGFYKDAQGRLRPITKPKHEGFRRNPDSGVIEAIYRDTRGGYEYKDPLETGDFKTESNGDRTVQIDGKTEVLQENKAYDSYQSQQKELGIAKAEQSQLYHNRTEANRAFNEAAADVRNLERELNRKGGAPGAGELTPNERATKETELENLKEQRDAEEQSRDIAREEYSAAVARTTEILKNRIYYRDAVDNPRYAAGTIDDAAPPEVNAARQAYGIGGAAYKDGQGDSGLRASPEVWAKAFEKGNTDVANDILDGVGLSAIARVGKDTESLIAAAGSTAPPASHQLAADARAASDQFAAQKGMGTMDEVARIHAVGEAVLAGTSAIDKEIAIWESLTLDGARSEEFLAHANDRLEKMARRRESTETGIRADLYQKLGPVLGSPLGVPFEAQMQTIDNWGQALSGGAGQIAEGIARQVNLEPHKLALRAEATRIQQARVGHQLIQAAGGDMNIAKALETIGTGHVADGNSASWKKQTESALKKFRNGDNLKVHEKDQILHLLQDSGVDVPPLFKQADSRKWFDDNIATRVDDITEFSNSRDQIAKVIQKSQGSAWASTGDPEDDSTFSLRKLPGYAEHGRYAVRYRDDTPERIIDIGTGDDAKDFMEEAARVLAQDAPKASALADRSASVKRGAVRAAGSTALGVGRLGALLTGTHDAETAAGAASLWNNWNERYIDTINISGARDLEAIFKRSERLKQGFWEGIGQLPQTFVIAGATGGAGVAVQGSAMFASNAMQMGELAAQEAHAAGASPEAQFAAFASVATVGGAFETVGDFALLGAGKILKKAAPAPLYQKLMSSAYGQAGFGVATMAGRSLAEGGTEAAQTIVENAAKLFYSEHTDFFEGVGDAATIGAAIGAFVGTPGTVYHTALSRDLAQRHAAAFEAQQSLDAVRKGGEGALAAYNETNGTDLDQSQLYDMATASRETLDAIATQLSAPSAGELTAALGKLGVDPATQDGALQVAAQGGKPFYATVALGAKLPPIDPAYVEEIDKAAILDGRDGAGQREVAQHFINGTAFLATEIRSLIDNGSTTSEESLAPLAEIGAISLDEDGKHVINPAIAPLLPPNLRDEVVGIAGAEDSRVLPAEEIKADTTEKLVTEGEQAVAAAIGATGDGQAWAIEVSDSAQPELAPETITVAAPDAETAAIYAQNYTDLKGFHQPQIGGAQAISSQPEEANGTAPIPTDQPSPADAPEVGTLPAPEPVQEAPAQEEAPPAELADAALAPEPAPAEATPADEQRAEATDPEEGANAAPVADPLTARDGDDRAPGEVGGERAREEGSAGEPPAGAGVQLESDRVGGDQGAEPLPADGGPVELTPKPRRTAKPGATEAFFDGALAKHIIAAGGIVSKSAAKRLRGAAFVRTNEAEWNAAPARLAHPKHNSIYFPHGVMPNSLAQSAFERGLIESPTADALWQSIADASFSHASVQQQAKEQEEALSEDEAAAYALSDRMDAAYADINAKLAKIDEAPAEWSPDMPDSISPEFVKAFEAATGRTVVFVEQEGEATFAGVTSPSNPEFLFVNTKGGRAGLAVVGHEFAHSVEFAEPELYRELVGAIRPLVADDAALRATVDSWYSGDTAIASEEIANIVGDMFLDPAFWQELKSREAPLFERLARAFFDFIKSLGAKMAGSEWNTGSALSDLAAARAAVADMVAAVNPDIELGRTTITPTPETQAYPTAAGGVIGPATISFARTAFHGTPHKVDKFSTENIGTGEGAQAYGWGLYFAESKEVGEIYRDNLSGVFVDGKQISADSHEVEGLDALASLALVARGGNLEAAIQYAASIDPSIAEQLKAFDSSRLTQGEGNIYKVNIKVEEDTLLDWDKPLSEQSKKVQESIENHWPHDHLPFERDRWANLNGVSLYNALQSGFGESVEGTPEKKASSALHAAGIRGIRYLDANSRDEGEGSSNYVIFDEADIEILEVNGDPVTTDPSFSREPEPTSTDRDAQGGAVSFSNLEKSAKVAVSAGDLEGSDVRQFGARILGVTGDFKAWSNRMVKSLGDKIRPVLLALFGALTSFVSIDHFAGGTESNQASSEHVGEYQQWNPTEGEWAAKALQVYEAGGLSEKHAGALEEDIAASEFFTKDPYRLESDRMPEWAQFVANLFGVDYADGAFPEIRLIDTTQDSWALETDGFYLSDGFIYLRRSTLHSLVKGGDHGIGVFANELAHFFQQQKHGSVAKAGERYLSGEAEPVGFRNPSDKEFYSERVRVDYGLAETDPMFHVELESFAVANAAFGKEVYGIDPKPGDLRFSRNHQGGAQLAAVTDPQAFTEALQRAPDAAVLAAFPEMQDAGSERLGPLADAVRDVVFSREPGGDNNQDPVPTQAREAAATAAANLIRQTGNADWQRAMGIQNTDALMREYRAIIDYGERWNNWESDPVLREEVADAETYRQLAESFTDPADLSKPARNWLGIYNRARANGNAKAMDNAAEALQKFVGDQWGQVANDLRFSRNKPKKIKGARGIQAINASVQTHINDIKGGADRAEIVSKDGKKADKRDAKERLKGAPSKFREWFGGRYDVLNEYGNDAGWAVRRREMQAAEVTEAIKDQERELRDAIKGSVGVKFFKARRVKRFLREAHLAMARLNATSLKPDFSGFVWTGHDMPAGSIRQANMTKQGKNPGDKFIAHGKAWVIGKEFHEEIDGYVVYQRITAEDQAGIWEYMRGEFPDLVHFVNRFIDPIAGESRYTTPGGVSVPTWNRHSLKDFYENETPYGEIGAVSAYTADVLAHQSLLGTAIRAIKNKARSGLRLPKGVGSGLYVGRKSRGRMLKTGSARESGNVLDPVAGASVRAYEGFLEQTRVDLAKELLTRTMRPVPDGVVPRGYKVVNKDMLNRLAKALYITQESKGQNGAQLSKLWRDLIKKHEGSGSSEIEFFNSFDGYSAEEIEVVRALFGNDKELIDLITSDQMVSDFVWDELMRGYADHYVRHWFGRAVVDTVTEGINTLLLRPGGLLFNWASPQIAALKKASADMIQSGLYLATMPVVKDKNEHWAQTQGHLRKSWSAMAGLVTRKLPNWRGINMIPRDEAGFRKLRAELEGKGMIETLAEGKLKDTFSLFAEKVEKLTNQKKRIGEVASLEWFADSGLANLVSDSFKDKSTKDLILSGKASSAALKASGFSNYDSVAGLNMIVADFEGRAISEATRRRLKGKERKEFIQTYTRNIETLDPDAFRDAYDAVQLQKGDYANIGAVLNPQNPLKRIGLKLLTGFIRWPYVIGRYTKRTLLWDPWKDVAKGIIGKDTKTASGDSKGIRAAGYLGSWFGLAALIAYLRGEDDEEELLRLGTDFDKQGRDMTEKSDAFWLATGGAVDVTDTKYGEAIRAYLIANGVRDAESFEVWQRTRGLPYIATALALEALVNTTVGDGWNDTGARRETFAQLFGAAQEFFSTGLLVGVAVENRYSRHLDIGQRAMKTGYDMITSRVFPTPWRQDLARSLDNQGRMKDVPSAGKLWAKPEFYDPGLFGEIARTTPWLSQTIPPSGVVRQVVIDPDARGYNKADHENAIRSLNRLEEMGLSMDLVTNETVNDNGIKRLQYIDPETTRTTSTAELMLGATLRVKTMLEVDRELAEEGLTWRTINDLEIKEDKIDKKLRANKPLKTGEDFTEEEGALLAAWKRYKKGENYQYYLEYQRLNDRMEVDQFLNSVTQDIAADGSVEARRFNWPKWLVDELVERQPRNAEGQMVYNGEVLIPGQYHIGHRSGHEAWREALRDEHRGVTLDAFKETVWDPDKYVLQPAKVNLSHADEDRSGLPEVVSPPASLKMSDEEKAEDAQKPRAAWAR